jgi:putative phosphoesterase
MKIAVLSDIHGNSYALEETLKVVKNYNITKIFILGDLIGYYYVKDILSQLNEFDCEIIGGNHEVMLKEILNGNITLESVTKKYGKGMKNFINNSLEKDIYFLKNLKTSKELLIDNLKIGLFHGSPNDVNEYIYPDCNIDKLKKLNNKYDYIFIGHTHRPFIFSKGNIINVGSVGQNRREGGISSWVIFDTSNETIQFMSTKYDVSKLINEIEEDDLPYISDILKR